MTLSNTALSELCDCQKQLALKIKPIAFGKYAEGLVTN
jgi:hypothetical protein